MADSGYSNIADATTPAGNALWRLNVVADTYLGGPTRGIEYHYRVNNVWDTPVRVDVPIPPEIGGSWICHWPRISIHPEVNSGRDVHVVWWANYNVGEGYGIGVFYNKITLNESGGVDSIGTPTRLDRNDWAGRAGSVYIGADAYGWAYATFSQGEKVQGGGWIYYGYLRVFDGGSWLDPVLITDVGSYIGDIAVNGYGDCVVVYLDSANHVHVCTIPWSDDPIDDVVGGDDVADGYFAGISYYGGTIYGADNDVIVVWPAGGVIRMCQRVDGVWGEPEDVPGSSNGMYPRVAGNLAGDITITWQIGSGFESPYGIMEIHRYAGGEWSTAVRLDASALPRSPSITARDSNNEFGIVWLDSATGAQIRATSNHIYDDQDTVDATSGTGVDIE